MATLVPPPQNPLAPKRLNIPHHPADSAGVRIDMVLAVAPHCPTGQHPRWLGLPRLWEMCHFFALEVAGFSPARPIIMGAAESLPPAEFLAPGLVGGGQLIFFAGPKT